MALYLFLCKLTLYTTKTAKLEKSPLNSGLIVSIAYQSACPALVAQEPNFKTLIVSELSILDFDESGYQKWPPVNIQINMKKFVLKSYFDFI